MSESDVSEPESPASSGEAKKNALLFDVWDVSEMKYTDPSMNRCIKATPITRTMSCHASKQFQESEVSIVEQLISRLMQTGDNTGHKQKTSKIVKDAFEIVNERTGENPVQMLIHAVENTSPHEETVRLKYDGISIPQVADAAPQRRVNEALEFIVQDTLSGSYETTTTVAETFAQQLIGMVDYDIQVYVIFQKKEKKRVAEAAR